MARQGENWAGVAVESRLEALRRIGSRLGHDYSGSGQIAGWLQGADLVVGLIGVLLLIALALSWRRDGRYLIVLTLLIGQAGVIGLGLRADYARYHLPLVLVMALGVSIAAGLTWTAAARSAVRSWRLLSALPRRLAMAPVRSALGWWVGGASLVVALVGLGSARGDELPPIVAWRGTPVAGATPLGNATPLAATPGATPVAGVAAATPLLGTPVATPLAMPPASPAAARPAPPA